MSKRGIASRVWDFVLYIGISVTVIAVVIASAFYTARPGRPITAFQFNWMALAGTTAIVFGETIRTTRRLWGKPRFWYVVAAGLVVQLGLGTAILWEAPRISTLIWGLMVFPLTFAALNASIEHFTRDQPSQAIVQGGPTKRIWTPPVKSSR